MKAGRVALTNVSMLLNFSPWISGIPCKLLVTLINKHVIVIMSV